MTISDLPLPLRLRNTLAKAGFTSSDDILAWHLAGGAPIEGLGETGRLQLLGWLMREEAATASPPDEPVVSAETTTLPGRWQRAATTPNDVDAHLDTLNRAMAASQEAQTIELSKRLAQTRAAVAQIGGHTVVSTSKDALSLTLENDFLKRLDDLVPVIASLPHVKELGVVADRKIVARMALIRGLDALERAHKAGESLKTPQNAPQTHQNDEEATVLAPTGDEDVLGEPPGWTKCGPNDKIPVPEAVLHDYYTQNGWFRYWGMVDGQPIYFYWSPERRLHGLDAFPGSDKSGRRVAVQDTPWGPGHVVPVKWLNA